jgi:streptolysin S family bacteriocin protoxin
MESDLYQVAPGGCCVCLGNEKCLLISNTTGRVQIIGSSNSNVDDIHTTWPYFSPGRTHLGAQLGVIRVKVNLRGRDD